MWYPYLCLQTNIIAPAFKKISRTQKNPPFSKKEKEGQISLIIFLENKH